MAIPERANLLNCDGTCSAAEWRSIPLGIKWETSEILKFSYRGEKNVKLETLEDTARLGRTSECEAAASSTAVQVQSGQSGGKRSGERERERFQMEGEQRHRGIQRREDAGKSRRGESRGCGKSLFSEGSESRELGASESTTRSFVSTVAECEWPGADRRSLEVGEQESKNQWRCSKSRIWRIR